MSKRIVFEVSKLWTNCCFFVNIQLWIRIRRHHFADIMIFWWFYRW